MSRPQRNDFDGAWHHVMNRGSGHRPVFRDTLDRIVFLELLADAARRHLVAVHAYCLMGNHFHILVENRGGSVAKTMQDLSGRYTRRFNAREGQDGPIFRGRYHSVEVRGDAHLLLVSRYIHANPVAAGLCSDCRDWRWSSAPAYLGLAPRPVWLMTSFVLSLFSEPTTTAYGQFMAAGIDGPTTAFYAGDGLRVVFDPEFEQGALGVRHPRKAGV